MQDEMEFSSFYYSMSDVLSLDTVSNYYCPVAEIDGTEKSHQKPISPLHNKCLTEAEYECLSQMYEKIYPCKIMWISAGCGVVKGGSGRGRRLSESALVCFSPGLYDMV